MLLVETLEEIASSKEKKNHDTGKINEQLSLEGFAHRYKLSYFGHVIRVREHDGDVDQGR